MRSISYIIQFVMAGLIFGCTSGPSSTNEAAARKTLPLLVGTYTDDGSEGIYQFAFDPESGILSAPRLMVAASNPSYLSVSEDRRYVYSVCEKEPGSVCAYSVKDDTLELVNKVPSQGLNPCYVDFHAATGRVAIANYSSGDGAIFSVGEDGSLSDEPFVFKHEGQGPNTDRQEAPHAHCAVFEKNGKFVYVVDLGIDQVVAYRVEGDSVMAGFAALALTPGDGPRHLIFHPEKDLAFVINELSNSVVMATVDPGSGVMKEVDRMTTLPDDFDGHSQCADIRISSDGAYVYASNRGHNSIAIFKVDTDSAKMERVGIEPVRGDWPRNFTLSPDERFLLVANQNSGNITVFSRDSNSGLLTWTGNEAKLSKPVCLKF